MTRELFFIVGEGVRVFRKSEVVHDPVDIKRYWTSMVDKDRAYFLNHYNSGLGFVVLLTRVSSGSLVFPRGNRKVAISPSDLWTHHESRI